MSIMLKENFYFLSKMPQNTLKKIKKKNNFGIILALWEKPVDELGKNSNETIQEERNINHSS